MDVLDPIQPVGPEMDVFLGRSIFNDADDRVANRLAAWVSLSASASSQMVAAVFLTARRERVRRLHESR